MSDNNKKIEDITNEIKEAKEEIIEELKEENIETNLDGLLDTEEIIKKELLKGDDKNSKKKQGILGRFFQNLISPLIDQTISLGISVAILFLFDASLKPFGYHVAEGKMVGMFFFIYIGINVLYPSIMKTTKLRATVGEIVLNKIEK